MKTTLLAGAVALAFSAAAEAGERKNSTAERNGERIRAQISCTSADQLSAQVFWRFRAADSNLDERGAVLVEELDLVLQENVGGSWQAVDVRVFRYSQLQYQGDLTRTNQIQQRWNTQAPGGCHGRMFRIQAQAQFDDASGRTIQNQLLRGNPVRFQS